MNVPPFNSWLGTRIVQRDDGVIEARIKLEPHHLNKRGVAHGGVVTALLDTALGAAVIASMPPEWWCATTSLATQFIDGAGAGELIGTGQVLRRGRKVAFATGEVRDQSGRLIATASGTWHLWSRKQQRVDTPTRPWVQLAASGERLRVQKIVAVGRNYADHVREMHAPEGGPPVVFLKPPSAIVHDRAAVTLPAGGGAVHHEVELVAVIGKPGREIQPDVALDHVAGYAVGLDMTLRELQNQAKQSGEPWSLAKGFDGSAPISPVVDREQVGDGSGLEITLDVNGERRQAGNTSQMLWPVADLIALVSRWITLERGDLIFTGTPAGVGPVQPGDRIEANVARVGRLRIEIANPAEAPGTQIAT